MITNTTAKMTYTAVSGVTEYAIGFTYKANPDGSPQIKVLVNKATEYPLIYGTDYTLSGDGLKIVLASDLETGDRLDIIRDIPMVQLSDYVIGRIDPEQIESDADLAVMRDQQLKADLQFTAEVPLDHEARIQDCEHDIEDLESLVPTQATDTNQLADKEFVNSSIATSTATFKGTYSSLADLEAVTADANDYGFVVSTDAAGNTVYSRYKYNGTAWVFEYNLNNSSFTAEQWAAINSGITSTIVGNLGNMTGKSVGEIFYTLRTDSTLPGAVACDGTQYQTTDFTGAESIGALLQAGKIPYMSLSDYATALAADGSVGVFGWDGVGTTAFKVPSLNDIFIETGAVAELGDYEAPAIPNITGSAATAIGQGDKSYRGASYTGALKAAGTASVYNGYDSSSTTSTYGVALDASESSSVYKNDVTTVQPQAVRYRAMVQLAVSATDEAVETCTSVLADVATMKTHEVIAFQAPTAQNDYTWYRKYADGWVEQGGIIISSVDADVTVIYPVAFNDANYTLVFGVITQNDNASGLQWSGAKTMSASGFTAHVTDTVRKNWYASGMAA